MRQITAVVCACVIIGAVLVSIFFRTDSFAVDEVKYVSSSVWSAQRRYYFDHAAYTDNFKKFNLPGLSGQEEDLAQTLTLKHYTYQLVLEDNGQKYTMFAVPARAKYPHEIILADSLPFALCVPVPADTQDEKLIENCRIMNDKLKNN